MLAEVEFSVAQNVTFFLLYHKQSVFAHNIIGDFMDFVKIIILSAVSFLVLFALSKFMGSRQISQLSFFDYVIGISIGSIAAEMATNIDLALWKGVLAMIIYAALDVLFELLSRKSIKARKFINGTPIIALLPEPAIALATKAEIKPMNAAALITDDHLLFFDVVFAIFPCIFLRKIGISTSGIIEPSVITQATVANTVGSVISFAIPPVNPYASTAFVAAVTSYDMLPITVSLIHGKT